MFFYFSGHYYYVAQRVPIVSTILPFIPFFRGQTEDTGRISPGTKLLSNIRLRYKSLKSCILLVQKGCNKNPRKISPYNLLSYTQTNSIPVKNKYKKSLGRNLIACYFSLNCLMVSGEVLHLYEK